jgi:hypothetical protein
MLIKTFTARDPKQSFIGCEYTQPVESWMHDLASAMSMRSAVCDDADLPKRAGHRLAMWPIVGGGKMTAWPPYTPTESKIPFAFIAARFRLLVGSRRSLLASTISPRRHQYVHTLLPRSRISVPIQAEAHFKVVTSSRDGHSTVDRQNLAGDHARFVTGEIKRHVGDIVRLDQAEQMRVGETRSAWRFRQSAF